MNRVGGSCVLHHGATRSDRVGARARALALRGHSARIEVEAPVLDKGERIDVGCRADVIVHGRVILEAKSVRSLHVL